MSYFSVVYENIGLKQAFKPITFKYKLVQTSELVEQETLLLYKSFLFYFPQTRPDIKCYLSEEFGSFLGFFSSKFTVRIDSDIVLR